MRTVLGLYRGQVWGPQGRPKPPAAACSAGPALRTNFPYEKAAPVGMGAHKTVILKITIMASVRRDWQRNNGYLVRVGYPLFYFLPPRKAIDLFTAFRYNCLKSILSHPFRDFFKKSQKSLEALEQFSRSHAIYSRGLNTEAIGGDADGQADRPERFSCGAAR